MSTANLPQLGLLVGYDGSAGAEAALAWAAAEAARTGVGLRVLLAVPPGGLGRGSTHVALRASLRSMLEEAAAEVRDAYPGLAVETSMPDAGETPAGALLRASAIADVVVVGSRGAGGFAGLLLGSVALRVCAHATVPVVVVPQGPLPESERIVVGIADATDRPALDYAVERARAAGGRVVALHAWVIPVGAYAPGVVVPPMADTREMFMSRSAALDKVLAPVRESAPEVSVEPELTEDGAGAALVEASADAGMVVVAAHRRRGLLPMRLGPTTHAVLHHARCPVAVVPVPAPPKGTVPAAGG